MTRSIPPQLAGIDFTCSPSKRKPITVAIGRLCAGVVQFERVDAYAGFDAFEAWLRGPGAWIGAFDFPFGLPRAFVESNGLGGTCEEIIRRVHAISPDRAGWRAHIDAWGNARPAGHRLPHRRTDVAMAGVTSTSPLQTRYVPVGWMYYEGVSRLVAADVTMAGLRRGSEQRVAVEGYPGLLAHELLGRRSYKNRDAPDRRAARQEIVDALRLGRPARLGLRVELDARQRHELVDDPSGDRLDALLCLVQAAWAAGQPEFGIPAGIDPVEGWITTAPPQLR